MGEAKDEMWKHVVAGAGAGWMTAIVTCPLDVIKVRLQTAFPTSSPQKSSPKPRLCLNPPSVAGLLRSLWRDEGMAGMYRGLTPTLLGYLPSFSIYFSIYHHCKVLIARLRGTDPASDVVAHLASAMLAGGVSNVVTNPLWVVRTRLMAQRSGEDGYKGAWSAAGKILRGEGPKGLYKGAAASLLGVTHVAVQFPLYEWLKRRQQDPSSDTPHWTHIIIASTLSKLAASTATYPHEVIRSRLQVQRDGIPRYHGIRHAICKIYKEEGVLSFYRGLQANILRVIPASCVTFVTYEFILHRLLQS